MLLCVMAVPFGGTTQIYKRFEVGRNEIFVVKYVIANRRKIWRFVGGVDFGAVVNARAAFRAFHIYL